MRIKKARPVAGFDRSVKRNGIVPCADGGVAIPTGGDHVELADGTGGEQLLCLGVDDGADTLAANLKDAVRGANCIDNLRPIGVEVNHWLFEVDVLACLHGVDCGLLVPVIGCGDENGVDIFARKNLTVIASCEEIVPGRATPQLPGVGEAAVVAVGHGDQFDTGNLQRGASVSLALDAGADEGELDGVIWRTWRR